MSHPAIGLRIYNSLGQEVKYIAVKNSDRRIEIDIHEFPEGIYFVSVVGENNEQGITKKFIKY